MWLLDKTVATCMLPDNMQHWFLTFEMWAPFCGSQKEKNMGWGGGLHDDSC